MVHLITKREAAERLGVHPESLMRMARAGRFPKPIKTGEARNVAVRFVAEEIDAWIAARMDQRDAST